MLEGAHLTPRKLEQILSYQMRRFEEISAVNNANAMAAAIETAQSAPSKLTDWNVWTALLLGGQALVASIIIAAFILGFFRAA